jgi:outer membrane protein TolC
VNQRWLTAGLFCALSLVTAGCSLTARQLLSYSILPEQTQLPIRDPSQLPSAPPPPLPPPRTVTDTQPQTGEWRMSLDQAIRIALKNANVIRVLTGISAQSSGRTIYDAPIFNTAVDVAQARFDPVVEWISRYDHTELPRATLNPFGDPETVILGSIQDQYFNQVRATKTNVLGGQWDLIWLENPKGVSTRGPANLLDFINRSPLPLNPSNNDSLQLGYTQPLLQGGGFLVNTAPIVIARIDTERSFFQYKDSVQELVRGVIEAYWNLVQARVEVWARQIQVDTAQEQASREAARLKVGLASRSDEAQARTSYNRFRANLIAAKANVLTREGALRNILGLPPSDHMEIVPDSAPTDQRYKAEWKALLELIEQRRPDIVELKLILEADQVRLVQAENQALPRLDLQTLYRWNGLTGEMPNGQRIATSLGEFTDWTVAVNFSVPLFLREGRARVRERSLTIARDRANLEQGLHQATHQVAIVIRDLDSAYEQYLAFKETRAAADTNLRVQLAQFGVGRSIYLTVLQALNDWGDAVSSEAQQLINYNVALARLERESGTILETHGLVFAEERFRAASPAGFLGHGRDYPAALPPTGKPTLYPPTKEPGENFFDLQKPTRTRLKDGPDEKKDDTPTLPPPRPVLPDDAIPKK